MGRELKLSRWLSRKQALQPRTEESEFDPRNPEWKEENQPLKVVTQPLSLP